MGSAANAILTQPRPPRKKRQALRLFCAAGGDRDQERKAPKAPHSRPLLGSALGSPRVLRLLRLNTRDLQSVLSRVRPTKDPRRHLQIISWVKREVGAGPSVGSSRNSRSLQDHYFRRLNIREPSRPFRSPDSRMLARCVSEITRCCSPCFTFRSRHSQQVQKHCQSLVRTDLS